MTTPTGSMTHEQLLEHILTRGLAAAQRDYAHKPNMLQGAIEGFEACRGRTAPEIVALHRDQERATSECVAALLDGGADYWRARVATLEVEWVLNVLSVGFIQIGAPPLLPHLPTARGVLAYAAIVGVRRDGGPRNAGHA